MQKTANGGEMSAIRPLLFGVSQGSVLGPLWYVLYTTELSHRVTSLHKKTQNVHVLGLEGHVHDTNTSPKTNSATTIEENIYRSNSRVDQNNNNYVS